MNTTGIRQSASFLPIWRAKQPATSERTPPPAAPPPPAGRSITQPARMRADDREFLPAAIEIYETPPSPVAMSFIWIICALVAAALAWSYFGWMDITAVASGKIQPSGRSKVVQPLEPGRVVTILVENGDRVSSGDMLLELDPTETAAEREAQRRDLEAAAAEAARRFAAIESARLRHVVPIEFPPGTSAGLRRREEGVMLAELNQLNASVNALTAQAAQSRATIS